MPFRSLPSLERPIRAMPASHDLDVTDEQLRKLWGTLSAAEQQSLLSCSKKHLFEEIRYVSLSLRSSLTGHCSAAQQVHETSCALQAAVLQPVLRPVRAQARRFTFTTWVLYTQKGDVGPHRAVQRRYEELRGAVCGSADGTACEACPSCQQFYLGLTANAKMLRLEASAAPLEVFAIAKQRERDRDLQFIAQGADCRPIGRQARPCPPVGAQVALDTVDTCRPWWPIRAAAVP